MSSLLISEPPLQVLPSLAIKIGLNEAIVLQQIHYWIQRSSNIKQGKKWIYNSYPEWQKQFPFWSIRTLKRIFNSLEKQKLIITGRFNEKGYDRTKWYCINYKKLVALSSCQNGTMEVPKWHDGKGQNDPTNTRRLPENTTEKKHMSSSQSSLDHSSIKKVIDYLNEKTGKHFSANSKANQRLVNARLGEGHTIDDCKQVIDNKTAQWLEDKKMSKYLRPQTLFNATNFEGYLNENPRNPKTWYHHNRKEIAKGVYVDDEGDHSWGCD